MVEAARIDPAPAEKAEPMSLRDNALDGFRNGACLDLQVRFAMDLLTHSPMLGPMNAKEAAGYALAVASELFALAESRGLIEPLDSPAAAAHLQCHIERQIPYQVGLQLGVQKEAQRRQEEGARIARSVAGAFGKHNG